MKETEKRDSVVKEKTKTTTQPIETSDVLSKQLNNFRLDDDELLVDAVERRKNAGSTNKTLRNRAPYYIDWSGLDVE